MSLKVALLGIYHESNTFVETPTVLTDFDNRRNLRGRDAIRKEYQDAHHEIGGMMEVMDKEGIEVIPVLVAEALPGGTITADTYNLLLNEMLEGLDKILPVDACLVVPHGAGVTEEFRDMDGHWLSKIREKLGPDMPIVGTLDLHANVSSLMTSSTDALVSYKENPHVDMRQTGIKAGKLLVDMLNGKTNPKQVLVQVPLSISIEQQLTKNEPCKSLYQYADQLAAEKGILSLSIQHGFPYADVAEMGTSIIVIADGDEDLAMKTAKKLEAYILERRDTFVGAKNDIPSSLKMIKDSEKPVLLLDMGDNVGGGGPANNICILEAFEASKEFKYFVCIYDPKAVITCSEHQPGDEFDVKITGTAKDGIKVQTINVKLVRLTDGNFTEANPRHGGQINHRMGKTAIVSTAEESIIMFTSLRVLPFSLQQLISSGVNPEEFDAIVAKGVNAPIAAYAPVCPTIIQVNTPGVTQADMTLFNHVHRRKPLFPFEK